MNSSDHTLWSSQPNDGDHNSEDFAHFLNYSDISLNFDTHSHQQHGSLGSSHQHSDPNAMDTDYTGAPGHMGTGGRIGDGMNDQLDAVLSSVEIMNENMMNMGFHQAALQQQVNEARAHAQLQQHQRQLQHQFHMRKMIPPTPSSLEMQGGDMTAQMYNSFYGMKDDQMIFTPLISPAVTPLDTHFTHLPDYTIGSAGYFSPLTSPIIEAQRQGSYSYIPATTSKPNTPKATSPVDLSESPILSKKLASTGVRRKSIVNRTSSRVVRESPSMKPQRKKTPSALSQAPELAQSLVQQAQLNTSPQQTSNDTTMHDSNMSNSGRDSSSESISPEPMPEALMAPPPPPTAKTSRKQQQPRSSESMGPPPPMTPSVLPVTPMMLMKLPKSSIPADTQQMPSAEVSLMMLDNAHPIGQKIDSCASSRRASLATLDEDVQNTPTLAPSNRTPARTPRGTPHLKPVAKSGTSSLRASRNTSPVDIQPSPISILEPANMTPRLTPKLQPQPSSASSRKRSIPASPALAPKISPSIKPLLSNASLLLDPSSPLHTAASLLLASKSNYQNIVEGNSSSLGLSYPEELSTGLTSKRTSHKIAEQGRRNRINTALQEMASLLPSINGSVVEDKCDEVDEQGAGEKKGKHGGGNQNTSKAVTVERAIEYIRVLKQELEETKHKLEKTKKKLKVVVPEDTRHEEITKNASPAALPVNIDDKKGHSSSGMSTTGVPEEAKEVIMVD
ncbi:hypothetical protein L211DRAFT_566603 [Terfezia boudieri ATCC MYA-4762]|uniref:BHLH domain-containing protein n=1 Tax=Terfezia boudieri ATCC MYA-4762 TaxID=1051890 RepID=A0A3N4M1A0_9PEZI|nr:hypothetical protein L211DRAFT_566603 [Terfezia boudieri ATCC MYA-4762]